MGNRVPKIHLYRPEPHEKGRTLCGRVTSSGSSDHEETDCMTCSGIYRTNMEWYLKVRNKTLKSKEDTGSEDIYTRADVEAGLMRMGIGFGAITAILNNTQIFRNVTMEEERQHKLEMGAGLA